MRMPAPKPLRLLSLPFLTLLLSLALVSTGAGQELDLLPQEPVVTQHTTTIRGETVRYTAEAGTLPIRKEGKVTARMFYVAYTRDGLPAGTVRPMVFSFNGGPGTASVWMHMGYTGPRRVQYDENGFQLQPPVGLENNPESILDVADIVYIDPVATGFSRMVEGRTPTCITGRWRTSSRWESSSASSRSERTGGPPQVRHRRELRHDPGLGSGRVPGRCVPDLPQRGDPGVHDGAQRGVGARGVLRHLPPQRAATAWYHKQLAPELQGRALPDLLAEVEEFALNTYLPALVRGDRLDDGTRNQIAGQVARYTGLSAEYVLSANLRIDSGRFWKELLRDQRLTVGRLDSRYLGVDRDAAGETPDYDPAMADWDGPFGNAVNLYLRQELGYDPDLQYNIWGPVRPWNSDDGTNVGEMLRSAMQANPYMKVLIQGGYFDAATDYFTAVYTISHIQPGGEFSDRFRFAWYESGHMMYLRKPDLANANQDLREFMAWCLEENPDYPRTVRPRGG